MAWSLAVGWGWLGMVSGSASGLNWSVMMSASWTILVVLLWLLPLLSSFFPPTSPKSSSADGGIHVWWAKVSDGYQRTDVRCCCALRRACCAVVNLCHKEWPNLTCPEGFLSPFTAGFIAWTGKSGLWWRFWPLRRTVTSQSRTRANVRADADMWLRSISWAMVDSSKSVFWIDKISSLMARYSS